MQAGESMKLPDLPQVELHSTLYIDHGVHWHEVCLLSNTVNYVHDHVVAMCIGKLNYEVDSDCIPSLPWSLC